MSSSTTNPLDHHHPSSPPPPSPSKRVLIAGGSLTGLTLALALHRAHIPFLLLEAGPTIAPQVGASLGLHPHGAFLLDQLGGGAWSRIAAETVALRAGTHVDGHSTVPFWRTDLPARVHRALGYPNAFHQRRAVLGHLRMALREVGVPDAWVVTGKRVVGFEEGQGGVRVWTQDGEVFEGVVLVGADGVRSGVRGLMGRKGMMEDKEEEEEDDWIAKDAFTSTYTCLFGISRMEDGGGVCQMMPMGEIVVSYGDGVSCTMAAGVPGEVTWFVFVRHDRMGRMGIIPTASTATKTVGWADFPRYDDADVEAMVHRFAALPFGHTGITVRQAWEARVKSAMVPLEEGVVGRGRWSAGRVVLVGDAVHKSMPHTGLAGNCCIEGAIRLVNGLASVWGAEDEGVEVEELRRVFAAYEAEQHPRALTTLSVSAVVARMEARETWWHWMLARYVLPYLPVRLLVWLYARYCRGAPTITFC